MKGFRRVHVFYRVDGKCVYSKNWEDDGVNSSGDSKDGKPISPETLWPLIQVFVQFAREVQGGSVKRLVFRNPEEYAPRVKRFEPAPHQEKDAKKPVVVRVGHDDLFVVTVTEVLRKGMWSSGLEKEESEQAPALTIAEFCESVLDFLKKEQASYVAAFSREGFGSRPPPASAASSAAAVPTETMRGERVANFRTTVGPASSASLSTSSDSRSGDDSMSLEEQNRSPGPASSVPVVAVDESRLSEFIAKTQNLLRM